MQIKEHQHEKFNISDIILPSCGIFYTNSNRRNSIVLVSNRNSFQVLHMSMYCMSNFKYTYLMMHIKKLI